METNNALASVPAQDSRIKGLVGAHIALQNSSMKRSDYYRLQASLAEVAAEQAKWDDHRTGWRELALEWATLAEQADARDRRLAESYTAQILSAIR